jgi:hypothetical protein
MISEGDTPEQALALDRAAVAELDVVGGRAGIRFVESLSRLIADPAMQLASIGYVRRHREDFSPARFRRDYVRAGGDTSYAALVSRLLNPDPTPLDVERLRRLGLDSLVTRHLIPVDQRSFAVSYLYLEQFPWAQGVIPRFEEAVKLEGFPALRQVRFVGDAVRGSLHSERLRRESLQATLLAFGLVGLLLGVHFRRAGPVLLCLVPLVAAVAASLAVMRVMGIELNVLTLAVSPILVGLCVDDGIHIVEGLDQGLTPAQVLRHSGAAMIVTTLTTIGAAACLGLASFGSVRELGLVLVVGLTVALLASLHLVPLGYRLAPRRKTEL